MSPGYSADLTIKGILMLFRLTCACTPAIAVGLMTLSTVALAQETSPANFSTGEKSLGQLIEFPELRGDVSIALSCLGILNGKGKLEEHGCFRRNPGDETFVAAVYPAIKKARLIPAVFDGKRVHVVFQYRVQFVKKGEEETLNFVANPGYEENVNAYGQDHIAAQRVYGKESWQKSCPRQARFVVLARANVDFDGTPGSVSLTHADGITITAGCEKAIIDTMLASRFIPAMADGEPVPSTYVEPFGN